MNVSNGIIGRRSIRAFSAQEPERALIDELLALARWSPSWGNTQPWQVTVASGESLQALKAENKRLAASGTSPSSEIPMPQNWPDINRARYQDVGRRTLESLSISRSDKEGRLDFLEKMLDFFDAPVLLVITVNQELALEYAMLDLGCFIQTVCLLSHERGLGTCIMAAAVRYPETLHTILNIPVEEKIVTGIALGYPDARSPVNNFDRSRAAIAEYVRWST